MTATTELINVLPVSEVRFLIDWNQEVSLQGGTSRGADLGEPLWTARITCSVVTRAEQRQAEAFVDELKGVTGTFLLWNPKAQYPEADPQGTILGAAAVTIHTIGDSGNTVRLAGLPVGYQISAGDFFSFQHGAEPSVRRCLHKFTRAGVADGGGVTPALKVAPRIREGATAGLAVSLKRPTGEFIIVPGSYDSRTTRPPLGAMALDALQVP